MDIKTNMGTMSLEDYRDMKAQEQGFEGFADMLARGFHLTAPITKEGKFLYKACIDQFMESGKGAGSSVLVEDFDTLEKARRAAKAFVLSDLSVITINEYDLSRSNVIAFESDKDTGTTVYRYTKGVREALENEFEATYNSEDFEGTMSYLIDVIKDDCFEELHYLRGPVSKLTDDEINRLLEIHGDLDYKKCVNGVLVDVDEPYETPSDEEIERFEKAQQR